MTEQVPQLPELNQLLDGDVNDWVDALPAYQRTHIRAMLEAGNPVDVATLWLTSAGPSDTAPYGGLKAAGARFYENLLRELQKLFCDADAYVEERKDLSKSIGAGKLVLVGVVSTAVAPYVGAAAAFIGPAVALTLAVLANAGKASVCDQLSEMITEREAAASKAENTS